MCGNSCCLGSPATQAGILQGMLAQNSCKCKSFQPITPAPVFIAPVGRVAVAPFGVAQFGTIFRMF